MSNRYDSRMEMEQPSNLFDAVATRDHEFLITEFIKCSRNALVAYLSLKKNWQCELFQEEKLDDVIDHMSDDHMNFLQRNTGIPDTDSDELPYHELIREIDSFLSGESSSNSPRSQENGNFSEEAERMIWQSIQYLSNSRPPSSFVIYDRSGSKDLPENNSQPIFDGHVANSSPPPLGMTSVRPFAGSGTLLHLACVIDSPFALSIFLALGADPRSPHTAFRRLMIHEAACSGSIQCLTLLLELGKECALQLYKEEQLSLPSEHEEHVFEQSNLKLPFFPWDSTLDPLSHSSSWNLSTKPIPSFGLPRKPKVPEANGWIEKLKHFFYLARDVRSGKIAEIDAARIVLAYDTMTTPVRKILAQSCSFLVKESTMEGNPYNCAWYVDGYGNTPLHWAAFKNEPECVFMLLKYHADPNLRAYSSGWTPLHDAAYSNSTESLRYLLDAGADVDIRANSGASPLCFAAQENAADAVRILLARGADITIRCAGVPQGNAIRHGLNQRNGRFSGYTPLHYCAHYNAHSAARELLSHTSARRAMDIADLNDRLPIHVALSRGSSGVLRELLHAGARIERSPSPCSRPRSVSVEVPHAMPPTPNPYNNDEIILSPISSPVLQSLIPSVPVTSTRPWNCLTQQSIDECKRLLSQAEQHWAPDRHRLFTPSDRRAVMELLRVGKRLELSGSGIFIDLWPLVLSFCGRAWFEVEDESSNDVEMAVVDPDDVSLSQGVSIDEEEVEGADSP